jgi:hypothetical protein
MAPAGVAIDVGSRRAFLSDSGAGTVRVVSGPSPIIARYSGDPARLVCQDGLVATASFGQPSGVLYDAGQSRLLVSDHGCKRVRAIAADGTVATVLGNSSAVVGLQVIEGALPDKPLGVSLGSSADGSLHVALGKAYVVLRVTTGLVHTFAGNWTAGYSDDGGLATAAQLPNPVDVMYSDYADTCYIADADVC